MTPLLSLLLLLTTFLSPTTCQLQKDADFSISQPFTSGSQNFDTFGSATLHSDTIVLTPHSPAHVIGAVWSKKANPHVYWEAEFSFRVTGAERGGTGLAFWYASKRGLGGNVFGSVDQWDGLGAFFDANTGGKVSFVYVSG
jgi:mannose-binding lectin 2